MHVLIMMRCLLPVESVSFVVVASIVAGMPVPRSRRCCIEAIAIVQVNPSSRLGAVHGLVGGLPGIDVVSLLVEPCLSVQTVPGRHLPIGRMYAVSTCLCLLLVLIMHILGSCILTLSIVSAVCFDVTGTVNRRLAVGVTPVRGSDGVVSVRSCTSGFSIPFAQAAKVVVGGRLFGQFLWKVVVRS